MAGNNVGVYIKAFDIPDAYAKLVYAVMEKGEPVKSLRIKEVAGTKEIEIEETKCLINVILHILHPDNGPPFVNEKFPNTEQEVMVYAYEHLAKELKEETDHPYTYRERIGNQLDYVIKKLRNSFSEGFITRQAVITISRVEDLESIDPPCFQAMQFQILPNKKLYTSIYIRSWDALGASNANMVLWKVLAEKVLKEIKGARWGSMTVFCGNAHVYKRDFQYFQDKFVKRVKRGIDLSKKP